MDIANEMLEVAINSFLWLWIFLAVYAKFKLLHKHDRYLYDYAHTDVHFLKDF